jgi:septum formation protein
MTMRHLSDQEIEDYLATREWEGCVGCYRAEGEGRKLFSKIGGDESAVIGLPIKPLSDAIHQFTAH